jgi:hypothetical protein
MQIKFKLNYLYFPHPSEPTYEVTVTAWIPKETGSNAVAHCCHGYLHNTKIFDFYGKDAGEWRIFKTTFISFKSFEEAEEDALEEIERYKKVVATNVMLKAKEKEIVIDFSELIKTDSTSIQPKEKSDTPQPK